MRGESLTAISPRGSPEDLTADVQRRCAISLGANTIHATTTAANKNTASSV